MIGRAPAGAGFPTSNLHLPEERSIAARAVGPCTHADHDRIRADAALCHSSVMEIRIMSGMTTPHGLAWWATRRRWHEAGLVIGECLCKSTIAITVDANGRSIDVAND